MLRLYFIAIISIFFLGCSSNSSNSSSVENQKQYLSIARASINSEVSILQKISLEFSTDLNISSVTPSSAYILDGVGSHVGLDLNISNRQLIFTPYQYFKPSSIYTIVVTTAVKSTLGLSLSTDYTFSFTTSADLVDNTPINFLDIKPTAGSTADTSSDISIQFSKNISPDSQYNGSELIRVTNSSGTAVQGDLKFFNSIATFKPSSPLDNNMTYTVDLVGTVTDMYENAYSGTANQWSFTTASNSLPVNNGYKSLYTYDLNKTSSSIIRSIKSYDGNQTLAVASGNNIEFFDVTYDLNNYPHIQHKPTHSYALPSQINAMVLFNNHDLLYPDANSSTFTNEQFIGIGTMSNGVYILQVASSGVTEIFHIPFFTIYDVAYSTILSGNISYVDRFYYVGPNHGLTVFNLEVNGSILSPVHVPINGTPLKVVTTKDMYDVVQVYVSDYNGTVLKFNKESELLGSSDLNGSTRNLVIAKDMYGYETALIAVNSLGKATHINLDANMSINAEIDMLSSATDINAFATYDNTSENDISRVHVSDGSNGLVVYNSDDIPFAEGIVKSSGHIVSSTFLGDFIATLDQEGVVNIFNAISDTKGPFFTVTPAYDVNSTDANLTLEFDEYLNPSTINHDSFTFNNISNFPVITPITFSFFTTADPKVYVLKSDANLTTGSYMITIKDTIEDMVGNPLNNGNSYYIPFTIKN